MHEFGNNELAELAKLRGCANPRLVNRIALVTGASRGLGRFFAEVLAREGANVILAARSSNAQEASEGIKRTGVAANYVEMDVSQDDSVLRAFDQIVARWGWSQYCYQQCRSYRNGRYS
jgi:NAD(P)-dependent dehydrogenase (short-subunit alcohol dehydrogenase family)